MRNILIRIAAISCWNDMLEMVLLNDEVEQGESGVDSESEMGGG